MASNRKCVFSRALWDQWLQRLNADKGPKDDQTKHLREGIRQFRARLSTKEPQCD